MGKRLHKKSTLWRGAILGGIVNAVMTAESHGYAHTRQWIKNHYILNGGDGRDGVITFAGGHWLEPAPLIGVFFDCHSDRSPYHWAEYDLERFFRNCSAYQRSLADQGALSFLQQVDHGKLIHRVTAVFWDDGDHLAGVDPWEELVDNGVSLVDEELIENEKTAFEAFQEDYGMSPEQVAFAGSLYERKMARPPALIHLTPDEVRFLESTFEDPKNVYEELNRLEAEPK